MIAWLDTLLQGIMLGGLYTLFAAGLSLIFGIMRLVNLAHGDLIVLAAFVILALMHALGLDPFLATLAATPVLFAFGYGLQHALLNRTLGRDILPPCSSPSVCRSSSRTACSKCSRPTAGGSTPEPSRSPPCSWGAGWRWAPSSS